ncbi:MAG: transglutaminase-like domain-containing protein, partial [Bacteroidales bacterium]|nr:transglutaminase-like domain-containing protein [Bacteroidales bacterium]
MSNYTVSGKSKTLKLYADVHDTIDAAKRIVFENYPAVADLSFSLQGTDCKETFENIWNFVRQNIQYKNDEPGKEQLRTPQRTLHDQIGDCDDMSILISSILTNLGHRHELLITAYKQIDQWQHIYPVAYSSNGTRYVIDCVPEIPYFNYEAKPIKNKIIIDMRLEELGSVSADMISELT